MASLKEVRNRITSVNSTKQITSAMKMVAAAKLRRAQEAITNMRPYAEKLHEILGGISGSLDTSENAFAEDRERKRVLIVAITSNRGLCGAFNNNIVKKVQTMIREDYSNNEEVLVLSIGKKAYDFFKRTEYCASNDWGFREGEELNALFDDLSFENVAPVAENVMQHFTNGHVDEVKLVYNQFKNAATQLPVKEDFLPIVPPSQEEGQQLKADYIFEPNKEEIIRDLIPRSLKIQFFKALLDSHASEHGARMTAMHQATDNATELLQDLKLTYNKVRQASITGEILEIVSGANALEEG